MADVVKNHLGGVCERRTGRDGSLIVNCNGTLVFTSVAPLPGVREAFELVPKKELERSVARMRVPEVLRRPLERVLSGEEIDLAKDHKGVWYVLLEDDRACRISVSDEVLKIVPRPEPTRSRAPKG